MKSFVALLCLASPVFADDSLVRSVEIISLAEDDLGQRLVFSLKEQIAKSATMRIGDAADARIIINIRTMDMNYNNLSNVSTLYSVAWSYHGAASMPLPVFLNQTAGYCGRDIIDQCANSLLAGTDLQFKLADRVSEFIRVVIKYTPPDRYVPLGIN